LKKETTLRLFQAK